MKITFLGATQQVTGSKYLIEHNATKILVDCGLYQGQGEIYQRNWDKFPVDPSSIDAIVLTHAHIDHSGYVPALIKHGFRGKVYCSKPTYALCQILLKDNGNIQEDDAKKAQAQGKKIVPLYTLQDALYALTFFQTVDYDKVFEIGTLKVHLQQSFHILGSSFVIVSDGQKTLSFSGDLGRSNQLIMKSPPHLQSTDFLVLESTYGASLHAKDDAMQQLRTIIHQVIAQKSILIIPAFAVERTQTILYVLSLLRKKNLIPELPVFLDSPMAQEVTQLFCDFDGEHKISIQECQDLFKVARFVRSVPESKRLNKLQGPAIIIAGSGMAEGGRVIHHFAHFISDANNIVAFVGFQAPGTHGYDLVHGAKRVELDDAWYDVRATIKNIDNFSAHADYEEVLQWLSLLKSAPQKVFLTHGELQSSQALQQKIQERFGWSVVIPKYQQSFDLK